MVTHLQDKIDNLRLTEEQDHDILFQLHEEINQARFSGSLTILEFLQLDNELIQLYPIQ